MSTLIDIQEIEPSIKDISSENYSVNIQCIVKTEQQNLAEFSY